MKEQWKDIDGFGGIYQVSNMGRIRSFFKADGTNNLSENPKIRKLQKLTTGYSAVCIERRNKLVHRLVAMAFIPNPENKKTVNHKNGVKTDNRIENLEWNTYSENHKHAFRTGIRKVSQKRIEAVKRNCGEKNVNAKLNKEKVLKIKRLFDKTDMSNEEIGNMFNVSRTSIYCIRNNQSWKHI